MNFDKPTILSKHLPEIIAPYEFGKLIDCQNLGGIPNTTYKVVAKKRTFAVRVYSHGQSSLEHIKMELDVLQHLEDRGFPAPRLLKGKDGRILQSWKGYNVCATAFITGNMADSVEITPNLAFNVGKIAFQLRKAMSTFKITYIPKGETFIERGQEVVDSLEGDLKKRGWIMNVKHVSSQWKSASGRFEKYKDTLDSNILSADIWPPNIKCKNSEVIALMDFDDCCYGATIIDLAIALMSFSMFGSVKMEKDIAISILRGYFNSGGRMTELEEDLIVDAIEMTCAMWLGYNVPQAPKFGQAEVYLKRLNMLKDESKRRQFKKNISDHIKEARSNTM